MDKIYLGKLLSIPLLVLQCSCTPQFPSAQYRLIHDLVDPMNYDQKARPVRDHRNPVNITIRMNLYQILDVNERNQNLVLYTWITQIWNDEFLSWNPSDYDNITRLVLPFNQLWLPDTYLYNSLEMTREATENWINVIIEPNPDSVPGSALITFRYPAILKISCKMNILYFPFDEQNCSLIFGSWTYDSNSIDYFPFSEQVLQESFIENEEWQVLSFRTYRHRLQFACCNHPFTLLNFHLLLRRKPLFYIVNLIFPTVIITFIAIVGFFMPTSTSGDRTEKVNLGITTLLSMSILLLMVSDQMPTTSDFVPMIGWFYLSIIIMISIGTFLSSLTILIHQSGCANRRVPQYLLTLSCRIARILRMHIPGELKGPTHGIKLIKQKSGSSIILNGNSPTGMKDFDLKPRARLTLLETDNIKDQIQVIGMKIDKMQSYWDQKDANVPVLREWDFITHVMDRLFLIIFIGAALLMTVLLITVGHFANQGHIIDPNQA